MKNVGKDAATVTNSKGGKQASVNYRFDLIPVELLTQIAEVLHQGAEKYGENNWKSIDSSDHMNHMLIHLYSAISGDTQDDHISHMLVRALMFADRFYAEQEVCDYRPVAYDEACVVPSVEEGHDANKCDKTCDSCKYEELDEAEYPCCDCRVFGFGNKCYCEPKQTGGNDCD